MLTVIKRDCSLWAF